MKIIDTNNFDDDYPNEHVVAENIKDKEIADVMCAALNDKFSGDFAARYYRVAADDYVLQSGFEP